MFQLLESDAAKNVANFSDPNDALEKRGFYKGIKQALDVIQTLYDLTRDNDSSTDSRTSYRTADDIERAEYSNGKAPY